MSNDLQQFHHAEEPQAKSTKLVGWVVLAIIIAGLSAYVVHSGMLSPSPAGAVQHYPRGL